MDWIGISVNGAAEALNLGRTISFVTGNLKVPCAGRGTLMHRRARRADVEAMMPGIVVQFPRAQPRFVL